MDKDNGKDVAVLTLHRTSKKFDIWTPDSGLMVSPHVMQLPEDPPVDVNSQIDYTHPQFLNN